MNNSEIKTKVIEALDSRGEFFQKRGLEYVVRCPFCGDSSNLHKGHFYIRINPEDNFPMVYHCFKCEAKGIINSDVLESLGVEDLDLKSSLYTLNKTSDKVDSKNIYNEEKELKVFNFKSPKIEISEKTNYICERIGKNLNLEELTKLKVITSLYDFYELNEINKPKFYPMEEELMGMLDNAYVGFLSFGNSYILLRKVPGLDKTWLRFDMPSWIKIPITPECKGSDCFYCPETEINPFIDDDININLSEGVLDIVSIFHNLDGMKPNTINIAVTGKYYKKILLDLLGLGLVGNNVKLNIYADNDVMFNKKAKNPTTPEYFSKLLKTYSHLYGGVKLHYNMINKDFGYPKENILEKVIKL